MTLWPKWVTPIPWRHLLLVWCQRSGSSWSSLSWASLVRLLYRFTSLYLCSLRFTSTQGCSLLSPYTHLFPVVLLFSLMLCSHLLSLLPSCFLFSFTQISFLTVPLYSILCSDCSHTHFCSLLFSYTQLRFLLLSQSVSVMFWEFYSLLWSCGTFFLIFSSCLLSAAFSSHLVCCCLGILVYCMPFRRIVDCQSRFHCKT